MVTDIYMDDPSQEKINAVALWCNRYNLIKILNASPIWIMSGAEKSI